MSMIRNLGIAAASAALLAACSDIPTTSSANVSATLNEIIEAEPPLTKEPINQCPTPFELLEAKGVEADDSNGDFWVCAMKTSSGNLVVIDNNIPPDQIGECPEHFGLAKVTTETKTKDRNGNGLLCVLKSETANAVIDDNHKPKH